MIAATTSGMTKSRRLSHSITTQVWIDSSTTMTPSPFSTITRSMRFSSPAFVAKRAFPAFSNTQQSDLDFPALLSTFPAYHLHLDRHILLSANDQCALTTLGLRSTSVGSFSSLLLTITALTILGLRSLDIVGWRLSRGFSGLAGLVGGNGVCVLRFYMFAGHWLFASVFLKL